jgi:hypothetical protein
MLGTFGGISGSGTSGCIGRSRWRRRRSKAGGCWSMAWRSSPPGRQGRVRQWRRGSATSRGSVRCWGSRCAGFPRPRWPRSPRTWPRRKPSRRLVRKAVSSGLFEKNHHRHTRVPAVGRRAARQAGTPADRAAEQPRVRCGCRNLADAVMGSELGASAAEGADRCARGRGP